MSDEESRQPGIVPVETLRLVDAGWTTDRLRDLAGEPFAIQDPASTAGPTETFQSLGFTIFDFAADRDVDEVWVYKHDRRGKFLLKRALFSYVGIRAGIVTGVWQSGDFSTH